MGWESQLCFPYPKWGPFPLLLIPCRIWNSPMSCAGSAGLTRIIAGLAIPVHPTVCGKWTSPNNLGSSSLPTLGILNYLHYGQSSNWPHCHFVDEISPFTCAWFSSNHDLSTPWPICAIFWSSLSPPSMTRINGTIMSRICLFFHRGIQLPYVV